MKQDPKITQKQDNAQMSKMMVAINTLVRQVQAQRTTISHMNERLRHLQSRVTALEQLRNLQDRVSSLEHLLRR